MPRRRVADDRPPPASYPSEYQQYHGRRCAEHLQAAAVAVSVALGYAGVLTGPRGDGVHAELERVHGTLRGLMDRLAGAHGISPAPPSEPAG